MSVIRGDLITDDGTLTAKWVRDRFAWYRLLRVNATTVAVALPSGHGAIRLPITAIREIQT